ncbi:MAG TPA: MMPL family transporter, partial [Beutenbergiaceae bacterium]|nr:MMPL family transporter [Beutenbergiaceae bacterium]
ILTSTPDETTEVVENTDGVLRVRAEAEHDGLTRLVATPEFEPGTPQLFTLVETLREDIANTTGVEGLVGGGPATDVDARDGNLRDLLLVAPLILVVSFLVLAVLLRTILAPVLLLAINIFSATAAIGAGAFLSRFLFGLDNLDLQVPLMSFLFLVALGIDYTIFLVHRARTEVPQVGPRKAMVQAVEGTGAVITSAGLVLAGVFAALGVLPLVTLGQLGLIVGLGVIIDTVVVRTILVPALYAVGGQRMWQLSKTSHKEKTG